MEQGLSAWLHNSCTPVMIGTHCKHFVLECIILCGTVVRSHFVQTVEWEGNMIYVDNILTAVYKDKKVFILWSEHLLRLIN